LKQDYKDRKDSISFLEESNKQLREHHAHLTQIIEEANKIRLKAYDY